MHENDPLRLIKLIGRLVVPPFPTTLKDSIYRAAANLVQYFGEYTLVFYRGRAFEKDGRVGAMFWCQLRTSLLGEVLDAHGPNRRGPQAVPDCALWTIRGFDVRSPLSCSFPG